MPGADPAKPLEGLGDCVTGGPACPVQAPPAVDDNRERFYLNFWPKGEIASGVRAFDYGEVDGSRSIREAWNTDIPGGVIGPPTLSIDRTTLYVFNRLGSIYALDADTGERKWDHDIGGFGFATMTVAPDGTVHPDRTAELTGPRLPRRGRQGGSGVGTHRSAIGQSRDADQLREPRGPSSANPAKTTSP